jgi:conjugative transfer signal peptidase TraF
MTARRTTIATMLAGVLAMLASGLVAARPLLVYNPSASAPIGFYRIAPATDLRLGDMVVFRTPPPFAALFAERSYLPRGVPLIKRVVAMGGMTVCESDGRLAIDGVHVADALPVDGHGRPMPIWHGCRTLGPHEFFALMDHPASLDGRYFGPVSTALIAGKAVPLWIFSRS